MIAEKYESDRFVPVLKIIYKSLYLSVGLVYDFKISGIDIFFLISKINVRG